MFLHQFTYILALELFGILLRRSIVYSIKKSTLFEKRCQWLIAGGKGWEIGCSFYFINNMVIGKENTSIGRYSSISQPNSSQ
jgi:hypothetical protein